MFADSFGSAAAMQRTQFIEPPWKMLLSNKAMLALLWEMEPGHPNLLPCFLEDEPASAILGDHYARKPVYSREGADIELVRAKDTISGEKNGYGREGFVRQALCPLPEFAGRYPVLGCWLVGDNPADSACAKTVRPSPLIMRVSCLISSFRSDQNSRKGVPHPARGATQN